MDILVDLLKKENTILTTVVWKLKIIAQCQLSQTIEDHNWKSDNAPINQYQISDASWFSSLLKQLEYVSQKGFFVQFGDLEIR